MGLKCCISGCKNSAKGGQHSFHRVPKMHINNRTTYTDEQIAERRKKWIESINRIDFDTMKDPRVCGDHFVSGLINA